MARAGRRRAGLEPTEEPQGSSLGGRLAPHRDPDLVVARGDTPRRVRHGDTPRTIRLRVDPPQGAVRPVGEVTSVQAQLAARVPGAERGTRPLRLEPRAVSVTSLAPPARAAAVAALGAAMLVLVPVARAADAGEQALAERYAPVVRIVEQPEACGPGEPYRPMGVDLLFGESTVALRGPWNRTDLVRIAPTAKDIAGLYEYHLDFPGNALHPGCDYERWERRLRKGHEPAVYAHVTTDPGHSGKLALQYWFF